MSSIKNLEMAAAISAYPHITIKKSLFSQKAVYTPTQSIVKVQVLEYTPAEGERLQYLLNLPLSQLAAEVQSKGKPRTAPNGHYRLEVCQSEDRQFCALQLFRFTDFNYVPVGEARFLEDGNAATLSILFD